MSDYPTITQGKTRIPGINDGEEFELTDVSEENASQFHDLTSRVYKALGSLLFRWKMM